MNDSQNTQLEEIGDIALQNPDEKKRRLKMMLIIFLCIFMSIVMVIVSSFLILTYIGKNQFTSGNVNVDIPNFEDIDINEDEVEYRGKKYVLNEDVVAVLIMGVDKTDINKDSGYGQNGQADCIFVAALNTKTKQVSIIPVSREAMVDINVYSSSGKYLGTEKKQVCLAYSYGKSAEDSSQNVVTSVKRMFYGINISYYITVDLKALESFTEQIGGVDVVCLEDMTLAGKKVKKGQTVNLKGKAAVDYIQIRGSELEANSRRMERQKQFLSAIASKAGNEVLNNFTKLGSYYNAIIPSCNTSLSFSQITYLVSCCISKDIGSKFQYEIIDGQLSMGEKWAEFTPSEESVVDTIMKVFYKEKK